MTKEMDSFFYQVWEMVRNIPRGKVASYGQIARLLGVPHGARTVGWALASLPDDLDVPWQRVVNAQGEISLKGSIGGAALQRELLEAEGVVFDAHGRIDLRRYGWAGLDLEEWHRLQEPLEGL